MNIEKNIPIPKINFINRRSKLVDAMEIGDSLLFKDYKVALSHRAMIIHRGWNVCIRTIPADEDECGLSWRVWRVK